MTEEEVITGEVGMADSEAWDSHVSPLIAFELSDFSDR